MTRSLSKQKLFLIAVAIFLVTLTTTFFLIEKDKLQIEEKHVQASLFENNENPQKIDTEEEYRKILDNYDDNFVIINNDRKIKFITNAMLEKHGYLKEEVANVNVLTFIHPKDLPELSNTIMEYHKTREAKKNIGPVRIKTKSGNFIPYMISLIPLKTSKEETIIESAVVLKDVSKPLGEIGGGAQGTFLLDNQE
jgi:PAS domain S-box-containing protein